jgi:hypothetical protein
MLNPTWQAHAGARAHSDISKSIASLLLHPFRPLNMAHVYELQRKGYEVINADSQ